MTITILKKGGEFFPPAVLLELPPIAADPAKENSEAFVARAAPLGTMTFRQPAVFRLDPKVRKDAGLANTVGSAALLAAGAAAMALSRQDISRILEALRSSNNAQEQQALLDRLFEAAKQDPYVVPALLERILDPKMPSKEILHRLSRLDLGSWEDLAKQDHLALSILIDMHMVARHKGAQTVLQKLDLQAFREEILEHKFGLFLYANDLMLLAELGNSQAWSILGEADINVLQSSIQQYRQGEEDFKDDARLAVLTMIYVSRSGGKNSYAAIEALRDLAIGEDLVEDREAVLEMLGPLLALGSPSAQDIARRLDLEALQKLPSREKDPALRKIALYDAIGVVLEHSQCKSSLGYLVQAVEASGDPQAFRILNVLDQKGYAPAQQYLRASVLLALDNRKSGRQSGEALYNLAISMLDHGTMPLNRPLLSLWRQVQEHPGIQATGSIAAVHEVALGIWKAWRREPLREIYLKLERRPMNQELIPSTYIEAYVERSLERAALGMDMVHDEVWPPEDWEGWRLAEAQAPMPDTETLETSKLRALIHVALTMDWGHKFTSLPRDQQRVLVSEIAAAWQELSPSDRQAFEEGSSELFPSAFLEAYHRSNSALFRPWSDKELGADVERDPGRRGPKGVH